MIKLMYLKHEKSNTVLCRVTEPDIFFVVSGFQYIVGIGSGFQNFGVSGSGLHMNFFLQLFLTKVMIHY